MSVSNWFEIFNKNLRITARNNYTFRLGNGYCRSDDASQNVLTYPAFVPFLYLL